MIDRFLRAWQRYWFEPLDTNPLPLLRVLYVGLWLVLWFPSSQFLFHHTAEFPADFIHRTIPLRLFPFLFPVDQATRSLVINILLVSGVLATIGLFTRLALAVFTLCFAYLFSVVGSWANIPHQPAVMVWILTVLIAAPGTTAWSIDQLLRSRRRQGTPATPLRERLRGPRSPAWGVKLILVLLAFHYFHSGVSKLRFGGLEWADGHTMAFYGSAQWNKEWGGGSEGSTDYVQEYGGEAQVPPELAWRDGFGVEDSYYKARTSDLSHKLSASRPFMIVSSVAALLFELMFPLVLVGPRLRALFLGSGPFFHVAALVQVGAFFDYFTWTCLVLFPWSLLRRKKRAPQAGG